MGERLTKEREEEIRARLEIGRLPVLGTALDVVAELLAELDALRAAPPTTYLHADGTEEPIGELVARLTRSVRNEARNRLDAEERVRKAEARVRELEAERDAARAQIDEAQRAVSRMVKHAEKAEADFAETRAQLARLREAAEAVDEADASGDDTVLGVAIRHLRAALSTTGPTLAEIRRAAQVEVLRDAARICEEEAAACSTATGSYIASRCESIIRQRADDLEAGRG